MQDLLSLEDTLWKTFLGTEWPERPSLERALERVDTYDFHGVFEGFISSWARAQGKSRWGEKTPQHTLCWRDILEGFPNAQVVHIVRDGRDLALSYRNASFGPRHIYPIALRWMRFVDAARAASAALEDDRYLEVRYEDLISNPEVAVRRICSFLGEDYDAEMIHPPGSDTRYPTDPRNQANLHKPILGGNAGKWRVDMSRRDLSIFEAAAGNHLVRHGYELALERRELSRAAALYYRYVQHPPARLWSMLKYRKAHRVAWQRMKVYSRLRVRLF